MIRRAYAIKTDKDGIDLTTVGPTQRSAMVNWLCTAGGLLLYQCQTDAIEPLFDGIAPHHGASCVVVTVAAVPEPPPAPTFEAGKSYRTRRGNVMKIEEISLPTLDYPLRGKHHIQCWTLAGNYWKNGKESPEDLLPGAIEDEKAEESDAIKAYRAAHDGRIPGDPFPIEIDKSQIAELSDLRQIHSRLNRQAERSEDQTKHIIEIYKRLDALTAERTSHRVNTAEAVGVNDERIDNIEKHCEAMQGRIEAMESALGGKANGGFAEGHRKRIEALEEQMTSALGITLSSRPRPATPVEQAIQALDGRINELENYTGLDVRSAKPHGPGLSPPPKPTIKGGWVNVYEINSFDGTFMMPTANGPWPTKMAADSHAGSGRIACIQIPDITEGEGL